MSPREKSDRCRFLPGRNLIYPGEKSHVVWSCPAGHDNSEILGCLPGRNPICVDFSLGEMRTCCTSPGEKFACVVLQLGKNSHMFDLSPGEINFRHLTMWIPPRGKSDICRLFPRGIMDMLHFSPGEICTCRISPGETSQPVTFPPGRNSFLLSDVSPGYTNFQICALCTWHHTSNMEQIIH